MVRKVLRASASGLGPAGAGGGGAVGVSAGADLLHPEAQTTREVMAMRVRSCMSGPRGITMNLRNSWVPANDGRQTNAPARVPRTGAPPDPLLPFSRG